MKALYVLLTLLALALAGAAASGPATPLLLGAALLMLGLVAGFEAWAERESGESLRASGPAMTPAPSPLHEQQIATIYLRSGRLVLRRRRA